MKRVLEGQDLAVGVAVDGVIPPAARLYHRTEGGAWRDDEMPADKGKAGVFHATVSHVMEVVRLLRQRPATPVRRCSTSRRSSRRAWKA